MTLWLAVLGLPLDSKAHRGCCYRNKGVQGWGMLPSLPFISEVETAVRRQGESEGEMCQRGEISGTGNI